MTAATDSMVVREARIEALVARYAPAGRRHRRRTLLQRGLMAGTGLAAIAAVLLQPRAWQPEPVTGAPAPARTEIARLESERAVFAARLAELESRLTAVAEQRALEPEREQGASLDREIEALAAQREALARRLDAFGAQGELLATEITAVNRQRKELEAQRRLLDEQQRELAELLDRAEGLYRRAAGTGDEGGAMEGVGETPQTSADLNPYAYTYNSLVADVNDLIVDNGELDRMRGGFSIGDGLDVSIGFTQTGALNGVEQYRNTYTIDSVAAGFDSVDMSGMSSYVLQNGSGNFVSPGVLDSLERNFGTIIQNTLDDQVLSTTTIYDISLDNVPGTIQGLTGEQALFDSLGSYR